MFNGSLPNLVKKLCGFSQYSSSLKMLTKGKMLSFKEMLIKYYSKEHMKNLVWLTDCFPKAVLRKHNLYDLHCWLTQMIENKEKTKDL